MTSTRPRRTAPPQAPPRRDRRLGPLARHWLLNIAIGLVVEFVVLHALDHFEWLRSWQNVGLDRMTRVVAATASADDGHALHARPLVFLDVDDRTWRDPAWGGGEPAEAPRPQLLQLIDFAIGAGARVVVLDIVVERTHPSAVDRAFAADLGRIVAGAAAPDGTGPVHGRRLLIAREVAADDAPASEEDAALPSGVVHPMVLDAVAASSAGTPYEVMNAAPFYVASPGDRVLRDWMLWQVACEETTAGAGRRVVVPSVQLLSLAAFPELASDADAPWRHPGALPCTPGRVDPSAQASERELDRQVLRWMKRQPIFADADLAPDAEALSQDWLASRIVYRTPDANRSPAFRPRFDAGVIRLSALDVLSRPALQRRTLSAEDWRRAIVVIGQSHRAARDEFLTPLGDMAGGLVVVNSIDSLLRYGLLHEPARGWRLSLTLLLIVTTGYIMARWPSLVGTLAAAAGVQLLALASAAFFRHGLWVDFTLPLLGVMLHELYHYVTMRLPGRDHPGAHEGSSQGSRPRRKGR